MYRIDVLALKKAMIDNGISTNNALADKANINRNTVSGILKGKVKPSLDVMYSIAEALKLNDSEAGKIFFSKIVA